MAKTKTNSKKSQKPEKSHRGVKIAAIIVIVLVLVFGGLAVWFFAYYNNPEKAAFDAMEHLFSADNVGFEGGITFRLSDEEQENSPITMAFLSFDSSSNSLPTSNTATLDLIFNPEMVQGEPKVSLKLSNVVMRNGVIYFQIGGIIDSLNSFSLKSSEWAAIENFIPILETIDNEWWQIDVNNIISELELSSSQRDTAVQLYSCVVEAMNRNNSAEMTKLYDAYRFVKVTPSKFISPEANGIAATPASWHNAYEVSLERTVLAEFINAIPETAAANEFYACFNAVEEESADVPLAIDASDFDEISASDIDLPEDLRVFIEVSTFGHQLSNIYVYQDAEEYQLNGTVSLKYQAVTVSAPTTYRPITDLIEEFIELLEEI